MICDQAPLAPRRLENLPAPAKLNLFLHVTGRRPDGMHLLESLFVLIDLADALSIEVLERADIERTGDIVGDPGADLCVRAARLLQAHAGITRGARIHVVTRIPAGAGMGGGSSDAATTLLALNRLWGLNYNTETLIALAAPLGADIPFFIFGRSAFASGIGEKLVAVETPPAVWAVIMPPEPTSTAAVFRDPALTRNTKSLKILDFSDSAGAHEASGSGYGRALARQLFACWPDLPGRNDLEAAARRINPGIGAAMRALVQAGASPAQTRMTGSGSAVFARAPSEAAARAMLGNLPDGMRGYVAHTLGRHPVEALLKGL